MTIRNGRRYTTSTQEVEMQGLLLLGQLLATRLVTSHWLHVVKGTQQL